MANTTNSKAWNQVLKSIEQSINIVNQKNPEHSIDFSKDVSIMSLDDSNKNQIDIADTTPETYQQEVNAIPYKKKPKRIPKVKLAICISAFVVLGTATIRLTSWLKNYNLELDFSRDLVAIASNGKSNNSNLINAIQTFDGEVTIYDYKKAAEYIINICSKNPELFDSTIANLYSNMNEYFSTGLKISVMDQIFDATSKRIVETSNNPGIFDIVCDKGFIDYLESQLEEVDEKTKNAINNCNKVSYGNLSSEEQDIMYGLISDFKNKRFTTYKDNIENVEDILNADGSKRGV